MWLRGGVPAHGPLVTPSQASAGPFRRIDEGPTVRALLARANAKLEFINRQRMAIDAAQYRQIVETFGRASPQMGEALARTFRTNRSRAYTAAPPAFAPNRLSSGRYSRYTCWLVRGGPVRMQRAA